MSERAKREESSFALFIWEKKEFILGIGYLSRLFGDKFYVKAMKKIAKYEAFNSGSSWTFICILYKNSKNRYLLMSSLLFYPLIMLS